MITVKRHKLNLEPSGARKGGKSNRVVFTVWLSDCIVSYIVRLHCSRSLAPPVTNWSQLMESGAVWHHGDHTMCTQLQSLNSLQSVHNVLTMPWMKPLSSSSKLAVWTQFGSKLQANCLIHLKSPLNSLDSKRFLFVTSRPRLSTVRNRVANSVTILTMGG